MTALEQAILKAAIIEAGGINQGQVALVLIGLILGDQPTRDAFIKQAAANAAVVLQGQLNIFDAEAAARKAAINADAQALEAVATASDPAVGLNP